jgi:hypothetical protein
MKFNKKKLLESLQVESNGKKTYSEKPQAVIITESQLERVIQRLLKNKK